MVRLKMSGSTGYTPNARERDGHVYYVAQRHPRADDRNPGAKNRPFKTIAAAAARAQPGDWFVIDAGTYREEVTLPVNGHPFLPSSFIVFKAAPGKRVYWKGSDVFSPVWQDMGTGLFQAAIPDSLFGEGVYNPYALSGVLDEPGIVRPCAGPHLPETQGQIYVNDEPLEQLTAIEAVRQNSGSFIVTADGRQVVVHFKEGRPPQRPVELTVRRRCIQPPEKGLFLIQTMGIVIDHAAEPGAFERGRPRVIRCNSGTGIGMRKSVLCLGDTRCKAMGLPAYVGWPAYVSAEQDVIRATLMDNTQPGTYPKGRVFIAESADGGKQWRPIKPTESDPEAGGHYFLDESQNALIRLYNRSPQGRDSQGQTARPHDVLAQYSRDAGQTWTPAEPIDSGSYYYNPIRMRNGNLVWGYQKDGSDGRLHGGVQIGCWCDDGNGVNWQRGASLTLPPEKSSVGPCEPALGELADGRLFVVMRQQYPVTPTQDTPGFPSVKFFAVSVDSGRTWGALQPLTYDDGRYVYSPASMPGVIVSSKTRRVYVLLNIADRSVTGCDPRSALHIAELDQERLCLKRQTVAIVDMKHEEHHHLVRFSNFALIEERQTKNWLLFMRLAMSEVCPIRHGYDMNSYRYEIELPS